MNTQASFERLLAWLVPIAVVAFVVSTAAFTFLGSDLLASISGSTGISPEALKVGTKFLQTLLFGATSMVAGVWLASRPPHASWTQRILWGCSASPRA
jgi:hypothetical protein